MLHFLSNRPKNKPLTKTPIPCSIPNNVREITGIKFMEDLTPRERRHQRTKEAILTAARQIINEEGLHALSMRAIAQRIDYSPAGLYEYFANKEEIVEQVVQIGHSRLCEYMERVDKTLPPAAYLTQLGHAYIAFAVANPDYFLLMFTTMPSAGETSPPNFEAMIGWLEHHAQEPKDAFSLLLFGVQRAILAQVFTVPPTVSTLEVAYSHWAIVHGLAMLRITTMRPYPIPFEQIEHHTLTTFNYGWQHFDQSQSEG